MKPVFEELGKLLTEKKYHELKVRMEELNYIDVAEFMTELPAESALAVFRLLNKDDAAEIFSNLEPETKEYLIGVITDQEIYHIIEDMYIDDAVDMLTELPANMVKKVLKNSKSEDRAIINQYLNYPDNSTGSIMTAEFIDLKKNMTVKNAIDRVRALGENSVDLYTYYVTDKNKKIEGVINLRGLLLSKDNDKIGDLMDSEVIHAQTSDDKEETARLMMKYDFTALPVADKENRLVGIVTIDDVLDVLDEEATEDFEKMAAMAPSEKPYLKTNIWALAKNRIFWLLVLMISATLTGLVLGYNEAVFTAVPALVTFMPVLTGTGGNAGSQSSTMVIRGMAVGDIELSDFPKVLAKEFGVSVLVGLALSTVNYVRIIFVYPNEYTMAFVVCSALFATVIMAKTIGGLLPIGAKALGVDPAIMSAPLITTVVDTLSLIMYFAIAKAMLPI